MTSARQMQEIIAQYERHGWSLRRVLLSAESARNLPDAPFGTAEVSAAAQLDALWFSRAAGDGRETWELRHLPNPPFALLEVFEADDDEEIREEARQELETRLLAQASKFGGKKAAE